MSASELHLDFRLRRALVKRLAWCGGGLSVLIAIAYGLMHGEWLNAILAGITLAMAILPEELPVVLTVFLGLGAWRMAHCEESRADAALACA